MIQETGKVNGFFYPNEIPPQISPFPPLRLKGKGTDRDVQHRSTKTGRGLEALVFPLLTDIRD